MGIKRFPVLSFFFFFFCKCTAHPENWIVTGNASLVHCWCFTAQYGLHQALRKYNQLPFDKKKILLLLFHLHESNKTVISLCVSNFIYYITNKPKISQPSPISGPVVKLRQIEKLLQKKKSVQRTHSFSNPSLDTQGRRQRSTRLTCSTFSTGHLTPKLPRLRLFLVAILFCFFAPGAFPAFSRSEEGLLFLSLPTMPPSSSDWSGVSEWHGGSQSSA